MLFPLDRDRRRTPCYAAGKSRTDRRANSRQGANSIAETQERGPEEDCGYVESLEFVEKEAGLPWEWLIREVKALPIPSVQQSSVLLAVVSTSQNLVVYFHLLRKPDLWSERNTAKGTSNRAPLLVTEGTGDGAVLARKRVGRVLAGTVLRSYCFGTPCLRSIHLVRHSRRTGLGHEDARHPYSTAPWSHLRP